jgi:hypothetical protein
MSEHLTFIDDINKKHIHNNGVIPGSIGIIKLKLTLRNIPLGVGHNIYSHLNTIDTVKLRLHIGITARHTLYFFTQNTCRYKILTYLCTRNAPLGIAKTNGPFV